MHINNVKHSSSILATGFIILFLLQVTISSAQKTGANKVLTKPSQKNISTKPVIVSLANSDTINKGKLLPGDSNLTKKNKTIAVVDTLNISKDSLDAPVKYKAQDSGVLIISTKEFLLYGKSNVQQREMNLDAGTIKYNGADQTVRAFGAMDSSNNPLNKVKMQDGTNITYSDSLDFNFKNQKARAVNSYYTEGELFVNAQILKKIDSSSFYGYRGRFTTCNLDVPHYAFRTRKLKVISNKIAVSGPASPEFEGVPIPIGIPFGIYPLSRGRHSGVLAPQLATTEDFGIGLQGLGYYKVISDNFDVTVKTDIYSYGGWSLNVSPKYIVRYKYQGGMNITIQNNKALNRTSGSIQEFTQSKNFDVAWNHTRDGRARPGTTFGANVHFGSTQFNRNNIGNTLSTFNNRINSSISYSKSYNNKANLSINASHNQNATDRSVQLQLPSLGFNVVTFYPFQKKEKIGKAKWYESLGVGYSGTFNNSVGFYDSAISISHLLDTMQWTATHNIPISLALPAVGPVTIAPSISYNEVWYDRTQERRWNGDKIDTFSVRQFIRKPTTSFGISLSTRIFGTYIFKHSKNIKAIRHEIRPTIGFNYTPNLDNKFNYNLQVDSLKNTVRVSKLTGQIVTSEASSGNISFGVDNFFEMKVKDKKDTAANATKKVKLLDVLRISSSYNLAADSFALQPFSIYLSTNLFEKINVSASTVLDPYKVDDRGRKINHLLWYANNFSLGRITNGNIAVSTQFKSKPKDEKLAKKSNLPNDPYLTPDEQQRQLDYTRNNPSEFTDFNIPWTLNVSYSLNFDRQIKADYSGFETKRYSSLNFTGDFNLTPKWKMGGQGYYDLTTSKLQSLSFFVSREMHCWQMSINVTPVGPWRSFSIIINPKSGILRDLKINRTRQFSNQ